MGTGRRSASPLQAFWGRQKKWLGSRPSSWLLFALSGTCIWAPVISNCEWQWHWRLPKMLRKWRQSWLGNCPEWYPSFTAEVRGRWSGSYPLIPSTSILVIAVLVHPTIFIKHSPSSHVKTSWDSPGCLWGVRCSEGINFPYNWILSLYTQLINSINKCLPKVLLSLPRMSPCLKD